MIVQIYEIQSREEARRMIALGVDHVGSVLLSARDWKNAELKATIGAVQAAGRRSSLIPLFNDAALIAQAVEYYRPDIVHFCDALGCALDGAAVAESLERQKQIRRQFKQLEIMRSIPIAANGTGHTVPSLALAEMFAPCSDWFLTDTLLVNRTDQEQPVSGYVGITGQPCDWDIARRLVLSSPVPVILAGGIGPENVRTAIAMVRPAGVDSCTRTNAVDATGLPIRFCKDYNKVDNLVKAARAAA